MSYDSYSPKAAKFLLADGSISGSMPVSTDAAQVTSTTPEYDQYAPMASKWLLPDGTVTDKLPISGDLGGGGDMTKAEYDTDQDGKVDLAETADSAPWGGSLASHRHSRRQLIRMQPPSRRLQTRRRRQLKMWPTKLMS